MKPAKWYVEEFDHETAQLTTGALKTLERRFAEAMADARRAALEEADRVVSACRTYSLAEDSILVDVVTKLRALRDGSNESDEYTCPNCGAVGPKSRPGDPFIHEADCNR